VGVHEPLARHPVPPAVPEPDPLAVPARPRQRRQHLGGHGRHGRHQRRRGGGHGRHLGPEAGRQDLLELGERPDRRLARALDPGGRRRPQADGHGDGLVVVQDERRHGRAGLEPVAAAGPPRRLHRVVELAQALDVAPQRALADVEPVGQLVARPEAMGLQQRQQPQQARRRIGHEPQGTATSGHELTGSARTVAGMRRHTPATHIEVTGARTHNLRDVSLRIPKHAVTVVTGVSGSGKSSLAFGTIAAESQRQLDEAYTSFARHRHARRGRAEVDRIAHLSPAIVVDQRRLGASTRSTVGTATDLQALLRLLFSRCSTPHVGESSAFSFNDPAGMCPRCQGLGTTVALSLDAAVDRSRSLDDGALLLPGHQPGRYFWRQYAESGLFDTATPLRDWPPEQWETLLHGGPGAAGVDGYEGLVDRFERIYLHADPGGMSDDKRARRDRFTTTGPCPECGGERLHAAARTATVAGWTFGELCRLEADALVDVLRTIGEEAGPVAGPMVAGLTAGLGRLARLGLGYLSLGRPTPTLSGGESQRVRMVRHLGSSLSDMLYVFDEPSVGLHPRDVGRLAAMLGELCDAGNTVIVVEHDRSMIEAADHVIDLGPGAGAAGGRVVYEGPVDGLLRASTPTAHALRTPAAPAGGGRAPRRPTGHVAVRGASVHNLRGVDVDVPTGVLTVVTGVAGSGKSTLAHDVLVPLVPGAVVVDQSPLRGSARSTPATATGAMDDLRRLFARANGVPASLFSANSAGACPVCRGLGVVQADLAFLDPLRTTCDACGGRRYTPEVLAHTLAGLSIADVLDLRVDDALPWVGSLPPSPAAGRIAERIRALADVGLGHLPLGRPLSTLSGGENQRLKLAGQLHATGALHVLDEPTAGLHVADTAVLLGVLDRLVDAGNTVVVVEHDLDVVAHADWVIDLGPGAGARGGRVLYTGPPAGLADCAASVTARYLRAHLRAA
jgi:excinuclease UvrABC ATPase subunit